MKSFLENGADVNTVDRDGNTALLKSLQQDLRPIIGGEEGFTFEFETDPLRKDYALVHLLMEHGADPMIRGSEGNVFEKFGDEFDPLTLELLSYISEKHQQNLQEQQ